MPYTPINWQTGDTITAEKLNKMDVIYPFVYGTTTWQQIFDAMAAGKFVLRFSSNDSDFSPDTSCSAIELVTETYMNTNGEYCVATTLTSLSEQAYGTYKAATPTGVLEMVLN